MNILSYRGPGMAGGVAPALSQLMRSSDICEHWWWYCHAQAIRFTFDGASTGLVAGEIPSEVIAGHYRYANEFLWPVMHGLCEYATYCAEDRAHYETFNRLFAKQVLRLARSPVNFVQDYQLAIVPQALLSRANQSTAIFWHIPWPSRVPERFSAPVCDLAEALLSADIIGFHTQAYAESFLDFICEYLPTARCDYRALVIERDNSHLRARSSDSGKTSHYRSNQRRSGSVTSIVVQPLGLDLDYWSDLSSIKKNHVLPSSLPKTAYVLSVDRADYTKGIISRLQSIDTFFNNYPELKRYLTFAQICTPTRAGLAAYDQYWLDCQQQIDLINKKHGTEDWVPILNIEDARKSSELALLYRDASVMLVNPLKDGLNLTAKEFVACQTGSPGVLALSAAAGVWSELGPHCVEVEPNQPKQMADAVYGALKMSKADRAERVDRMIKQLRRNTLSRWCDTFAGRLQVKGRQQHERTA